MGKVNLDAMILRENFSIDNSYASTNRLKQTNMFVFKKYMKEKILWP